MTEGEPVVLPAPLPAGMPADPVPERIAAAILENTFPADPDDGVLLSLLSNP